jgi:hypothetical protein
VTDLTISGGTRRSDRVKQISQFTVNPDRGLFIDLEDAPLSAAVNIRTGEILLHEGTGDGRLNNVCIRGQIVKGFRAEVRDGEVRVFVDFKNDRNLEPYLIGASREVETASAWIKAVNGIYNGKVDQTALREFIARTTK